MFTFHFLNDRINLPIHVVKVKVTKWIGHKQQFHQNAKYVPNGFFGITVHFLTQKMKIKHLLTFYKFHW